MMTKRERFMIGSSSKKQLSCRMQGAMQKRLPKNQEYARSYCTGGEENMRSTRITVFPGKENRK